MDTIMFSEPTTPSNTALWTGRILGTLVILALLADASVSLFAPHLMTTAMQETGFPVELAPVIGSILALSVALYAIPQTSVLGAILVTGFLGGAICTHLRLGEIGSPPQIVSLLLGAAAWGALYLRSSALRGLIPTVDTER